MTDLEALRPLFEELDAENRAARTAAEADDMQGWLGHATRAAELHEQLAVRFGWRDEPPEIIADPVTRGDLESIALATGGYAKNKNFIVEYEDDDD